MSDYPAWDNFHDPDDSDFQVLLEQEQKKLNGVAKAAGKVAVIAPNLLMQHLSDYGNSRRLMALHGEDLRYCHDLKKWLNWDERRWQVDGGERAREW